MSEDLWPFLIIYFAGYFLALMISTVLLLRDLLTYNSIYRRNMRLILTKVSIWKTEEYYLPEDPSFVNALKEFALAFFLIIFNSLLSWIQVSISVFSLFKKLATWLLTPPEVKLFRWKIRNNSLVRAEDFLHNLQEHGVLSGSENLLAKSLEDLAEHSYQLTKEYAQIVFSGEDNLITEYLSKAKLLTKRDHDSVVIHPRFWAIPQDRASARLAVNQISTGNNWFSDYCNETSQAE